MRPVRSNTYQKRSEINQFGFQSAYVQPDFNATLCCRQTQHTLWANFQNTNVWIIGSGTDGPDSDQYKKENVELTRVYVDCDITPNLNIDAYDGEVPMDWPVTIDWMLYLTRKGDQYNGTPQFLLPINDASYASDTLCWSQPLLNPTSTPLDQILAVGVETIQPMIVADQSNDFEMPLYTFVLEAGTGELIMTRPETNNVHYRCLYGSKNHAKIRVDKCFNEPQLISKDAQIRMNWRLSAGYEESGYETYGLDNKPFYPRGGVKARGIIQVDYRM